MAIINKFEDFGKVNEGHVNFTDKEKEAIKKATENYMTIVVEDLIEDIGDNGYWDICDMIDIDITIKLDELGYGNPREINEEVKQSFINMLTESFLKTFESFDEDEDTLKYKDEDRRTDEWEDKNE